MRQKIALRPLLSGLDAPGTLSDAPLYVRDVAIRYRKTRKKRVPIRDRDAVAALVRSLLPDNVQEHVVALYLDGAHMVCDVALLFTGSANACTVHPREVFQRAVLCGACAVIVAHNHPSEETTPSKADREVTDRLVEAGKVLGIPLLDHVIVTATEAVSILEESRR